LFASAIIGAVYLGLPLSLVRSKFRLRRNQLRTRPVSIGLLAGIAMLGVGEILSSSILLIIAGPVIVMSMIILSGFLVSGIISERLL